MGVAYTIHDTLQISEPAFSVISFIPGILSIAALVASGVTRKDFNLRFAWFSKSGIAVLALIFLLLLPTLLSSTGDVGWNWLSALVYAPASGIAQEFYFRSALLPALTRALGA
jgi:membrane protease YdiL (CAAX protease family)